MKFKNDVEVQNSEIKISSTTSAHLILNGDTANIGDSGDEDAIIDFLHDNGSYGYRLNSENWPSKSAFNIQENTNGTYTSRLYIDKDGKVGIGTNNPESKLHVFVANVGVRSAYGTAMIESNDAQLDLVSSSDGTWGSSINLIQGNGTTNTNVWSIARTTSGGDNKLNFNFGTDNDHVNETKVTFAEDGFVGIGIDDPQATLHVRSANNVTGSIEIEGGRTSVTAVGEINSELNFGSRDASATGGIGGSIKSVTEATNGSTVGLAFYTADQGRTPVLEEAMRINKAGNVGIGTDNPTARLHLKSEGTNKYVLRATKSSNGNDLFGFYEDGGSNCELYLKDSASTKILINSNGDSYFNGGDVGIGTTNPQTALQVGDGTASDSVRVLFSDGAYTEMRGYGLQFSREASYLRPTVDAAKTMYFGTLSATWALLRFDALQYDLQTNGVSRLKIGGTGKVGIGPNNPVDALNIDWDADGVATDNSGIRVRAYKPHLNLIDRSGYTTSNGHNFQIKADIAKLQFNATSADNETFDLTRMVIDKDGDVGIGTFIPLSKLHVSSEGGANGDCVLLIEADTDNTVETSNPVLRLKQDGGAVTGALSMTSNNHMALYNEYAGNLFLGVGGATKMTIFPNGNVGIGTTTPNAKLDIKDIPTSGNGTILNIGLDSNSPTRAKIGVENYNGVFSLYDSGNVEDVKITTNGDSWFNGGDVGIGTTTPGYKLDVSGNGRFSNLAEGSLIIKHNYGYQRPNWAIKLDGDANTSGGYLSQYVNQGGFTLNQGGTYYASSLYRTDANSTSYSSVAGINGELTFYTNTSLTASTNFYPSERMRIESGGNVGIGTTSPDSLLNLEGAKNTSIITLGSTTNNGSWSVGDKYGAIDFYSGDGSGAGSGVKASISYEVEAGVTGSTNSMVFRTAGTSSGTNNTERMRIESSGITRFSTTPIVLTRNSGDNTTYAASTAYVDSAVAPLGGIVDNSNATVTASQPGWVTVALANTARRAGEIYVTDGESGDHSFIRISWMRSYNDSNFTVLNCGGHQNRIQGVRVLQETNDAVYGNKYLQVLVTTTSNYYVAISAPGPIPNYSNFTAVTPVLENTKTGYSVTGSQLEDLQNSSVGTDEGITVGEELYVNGTGNSYFTGNVGIGYDNPQSKLQVSSGNISETTLMVGASGTISDVSSRILLNEGEGGSPPVTNSKDYGFSLAYNGSGLSYGLASNEFAIIRHNNSATGVPVLTMSRANNNAEFAGTVEATNFQLSSDKRLKNNIKEIDTKHIGVNWKNFELKSEPGVKRSGVIAQELEKKHPEFVKTNDKGMKSVAYIDLLIAKIAELEARLEKAGI